MKTLHILAIAVVLASGMPAISSFADAPSQPAASADAKIPDVKYPFTFVCPHCNMKITVKSKEDWFKHCGPCPCGTNNLGCYKAIKKK